MKRVSIYNNYTQDNPANRIHLEAKLKRRGFETGKGGEYLAVIGGDGTFLTAVNKNVKEDPVYIVFNAGNLGFFSEFDLNEADKVLDMIQRRDYVIQKLPLYEVVIKDEEKETVSYFLNDVCIERKSPSIIHTSLHINDQPFSPVSGDGVVISSPFGSTGYSLSAKGAMNLDCDGFMQITPVSPVQNRAYHSLPGPVLVKDTNEICIFPNFKKTRPFRVVCDNKEFAGKNIRYIEIKKSPYSVRVLRSKQYSSIQNVRHKILNEE